MIRALWYLFILSLFVWLLVWLADRPGSLVLNWQGYEIKTTASLLVGAIVAVAAFTAMSYRLWLFLRRAPSRVSGAWKQRQKQQGYQALTRGMVAVAAGDAEEARRSVKRAEVLLNEPPLTMLLSAQTAQLNGDEKAAQTFFQAMTENPETEFLGIRGLLTQAVKNGDTSEALQLARRAYRLRPKSEWVSNHLFELQTREGLWLDARVTSEEQVRNSAIDKSENNHRQAALYYQMGQDALAAGDDENAFSHFKKATDNDAAFVPAIAAYGQMLVDRGKRRKAISLIEKAWARSPHPSLVPVYWQASEAKDGLARVKATERLSKSNSAHLESEIALVRAALDAELWGEARQHLAQTGDETNPSPDARICRLWAELEEGEHGDLAKAHNWLTRASVADGEPAWVCNDCGNTLPEWVITCANCDGFNTFTWRRPLHVGGLISETKTDYQVPSVVDGTPKPLTPIDP